MISPPMFRPLTVLAQLHIEENDLHSEDEWKMGGNMRPPPEAPLVERRWSGECWPTISWGYTLSPLRGSTALYWDLPTLTKKTPKKKQEAEEEEGKGGVTWYITWRLSLNMVSGSGGTSAFRSTMAPVSTLAVFAALSVLFAPAGAEIRSAVLDKQSGQLSVVEGFKEHFIAWANFTDDIKTSG